MKIGQLRQYNIQYCNTESDITDISGVREEIKSQ